VILVKVVSDECLKNQDVNDSLELGNYFECAELIERSCAILPSYEYPIRSRTIKDDTDFIWYVRSERLNKR
jgi:hypothetical protein